LCCDEKGFVVWGRKQNREDKLMLAAMPTPEMIKEWKIISEEYKPRLSPNKKTGRYR